MNEVSGIWEKIPTVFDEQTGKLESTSDHLSWFSVFGEKIDSEPPKTQIILSGNQIDGWFTEHPLVELAPENENPTDLEFTVYSVDEGDFWRNYNQPFYIEQDGIINLLYKSQDTLGNLEFGNNYVLHINTDGLKTGRIKVKNARYEVN
jgi:hypothetical protein